MSDPSRSSGIVLHPASLPGRFGIGELGSEAQRWLESLSRMGQSIWHLHAEGTAFPLQIGSAGNPLLMSFDALRNDGVLQPADLAMLPAFNDERIDAEPVIEVRTAFLRLAARRFLGQSQASPLLRHAFERFCEAAASWLEDYALVAALRTAASLGEWSGSCDLATMTPETVERLRTEDFSHEIDEQKVLQFLFFRQWHRLRASAHELGIRLLVDAPEATDRIGDVIDDRDHIVSTMANDGWQGIESSWESGATNVLCPAQAMMEVTTPAAEWRFTWDQFTSEKQLRLRTLTAKFGRM
jgi:4-alpha-glucanotransferase